MAIQRLSTPVQDVRHSSLPTHQTLQKPLTSPQGFFSDIQKRVTEIFRKAQENFALFRSSPLAGIKRFWTHIVNTGDTAGKVSVAANVLTVAAVIIGLPVVIAAIGLISSNR